MASETDVWDADPSAIAPTGSVLTKTEHQFMKELPRQLADALEAEIAHPTTTGHAPVTWFVHENAPMHNLSFSAPVVSDPTYSSTETSRRGVSFPIHLADSSHADVSVLLTWLIGTILRTSTPSEGLALFHSGMKEVVAFCAPSAQTSPPVQIWEDSEDLSNALSDLHGAMDEATEEGYRQPSDDAVTEAERILRSVCEVSPRRFEVYPTQDGEIALDAPGNAGSVILLLDPHGCALCLVNVNGNHRRARYSSTTTLPDGFVREALVELDRQEIAP